MISRPDVLVVGAGPAGAMAALLVARRGHSVLLVDRAAWPRPKVCGACLSARAVGRLEAAGLGGIAERGVPLRRLRLAAGGRSAVLPLPGGRALGRAALDAALVEAAVAAGARFVPATRAALGPVEGGRRRVLLDGRVRDEVAARVVVAAGGLHGAGRARAGSRIGAGATAPAAPGYDAGTITMAVGRAGYAGVVRLEDGRWNVAAALRPEAIRRRGIGATVEEILSEAGLPSVPGLAALAWRGTPALTRRGAAAAARVLAVGDAAGYIEPFTGQGIAAALASAAAVGPYIEELVGGGPPGLEAAWAARARRIVRAEFRGARLLARLVGRPALVRAAVGLTGRAPAVAAPVVRLVTAPA